MRNYEIYLLFNPSLSDNAVDQAIKEFEALLAKHKGRIINIDKKGKQRLAYEIKGKKDAHHVILNVEADPQSITAIKRQVEITSDIMRMLASSEAKIVKVN